MEKELIEGMSAVIRALENVEVKGKTNLINLSGCIAILENMRQKYINYIDSSQNGRCEPSIDTEE